MEKYFFFYHCPTHNFYWSGYIFDKYSAANFNWSMNSTVQQNLGVLPSLNISFNYGTTITEHAGS